MLDISEVNKFLTAVKGMYSVNKEQLILLSKAKETPHSLDDMTVARIIQVFTDQQKEIEAAQQQCAYWKKQCLSEHDLAEVQEIEKISLKVMATNKEVLDIAYYCKDKTIEKVMGKEDAELGLEFLRGMMNGKQ